MLIFVQPFPLLLGFKNCVFDFYEGVALVTWSNAIDWPISFMQSADLTNSGWISLGTMENHGKPRKALNLRQAKPSMWKRAKIRRDKIR